ncbi:TPA: hypothetical protein DE059_03390, partial [Candidatus Peribacteria bacterium]|nr:hypothetical protein [Candidatus Peribacteria bacterium]
MKKYFLGIVSIALVATACAKAPQKKEESTTPLVSSTSEEEKAEVRETKNVIYQGVVKPAGISIYQQGSHRLQLETGKFILLESDTVDLNGYVGEHVEMVGAIRPTVEEGGMIMRVESAKLIIDEKETDVVNDKPEEETEEAEEAEE